MNVKFQLKLLRLLVLILMGQFVSSPLRADSFFFNPAIHYRSSQELTEFSGGKTETSRMTNLVNVTAGYSFGSGLLLGLKYFGEEQGSDVLPISGGQGLSLVDLKVSASGAGVGFLVEGLSFFLSVLAIQAPKKIDQNRNVEYHGGTGTILDFAYYAEFGDLLIGPQLSWRSFEFKDYRYGGNQTDPVEGGFVKLKEQHIEPYLSFLFLL